MKKILPIVFAFMLAFLLPVVGNEIVADATESCSTYDALKTAIGKVADGTSIDIKLTGNITVTDVSGIEITAPSQAVTITIDLAGCEIDCNNNRFITVPNNVTLIFTDSVKTTENYFKVESGNGRWNIWNPAAANTDPHLSNIENEASLAADDVIKVIGGVIYGGNANNATKNQYNGGCVYVCEGGTFTLESGYIVGGSAQNNGAGVYNCGTFNMSGGGIFGCATNGKGAGIYNCGTLNITGGSIVGNYARRDSSLASQIDIYMNSLGNGGGIGGTNSENLSCGVVETAGTLEISNCTINFVSSGSAIKVTGGTATFANCTIENCTGTNGAALYIAGSNAQATLTNCVINSNDATGNGGALYLLDKCSAVLNSCTINSGSATNGLAIYAKGTGDNKPSLELRNCTIKSTSNSGYCVYITNGTLTINEGSKIYGDTTDSGVFADKTEIKLSGAVIINGKNIGLYIGDSCEITSNLTVGASIGVTLKGNTGRFITGSSSEILAQRKYYYSDKTSYVVNEESDGIYVLEVETKIVNSSSSLYDALKNALDGNTIILGANITMSDDTATTGVNENTEIVVTAKMITIDLNGFSIDCNGHRFININSGASVILTDSAANSTSKTYFIVDSTGKWLKSDSTTNAKSYDSLTAVPVENDIIYVTGGAIYNAKNTDNGGCVYVEGNFVMNGGAIVGAEANYGAGVYIQTSSSFTMNGGAILGCYATVSGAGVLNHNTFVMTGGTIAGNCAGQEGGGLNNWIDNGATCTISGGSISYNHAGTNGGGIYNAGHSTTEIDSITTISNATIKGNTATEGAGILNNGTLDLNDGTVITGNIATTNGGGVCYYNGTVNLSGNVQITENKSSNVYLGSGKIVNSNLSGAASVGITLVTWPTNENPSVVITNAGANQAQYFFSDNASYGVQMGDDGKISIIDDGNSGKSLTLDGTVGANSYIDVSTILGTNWQTNYPNAYIELSYNANTTSYDRTRTTEIYELLVEGANGQIVVNPNFYDEGKAMFKFTCTATPAQMNDTFTIRLYTGGDDNRLVYKNDDTIAAWCQRVIATYDTEYYKQNDGNNKEAFVTLCKSILDYGIAAQNLFDYNTGNVSNNGSFYNLSNYDNNLIGSYDFKIKSSNNSFPKIISGLTFLALTDSSIRIYYEGTNLKLLNVTTDSGTNSYSKYGLGSDGNGNYIEIYGIPVEKLNDEFAIQVSCNDVTATLTVYGLSYAKIVLDDTANYNENLINLCKALVLYNKAANEYFGSKAEEKYDA